MLIVVSYDINTETKQGRARLRKIAKICLNFGQRVQNSVFECVVDPVQYSVLKNQLNTIMDTKKDSIRFYNLGKHHQNKTEHFGVKPVLDLEGVLIL